MQKNPSDLGFVDGDLIADEDEDIISEDAPVKRDELKTIADDIIEEAPDLYDDDEEAGWGGPEGFADKPEAAQVAPPTPEPKVTEGPKMEIAIPSAMGHKTNFVVGDPIGPSSFNAEGSGGSYTIDRMETTPSSVIFHYAGGGSGEWNGFCYIHRPAGYKPEGGK